jgi:hypothetical protein
MVGERVALLFVVIVGHSRRAPCSTGARAHRRGRVIAWAI